MTQQITVLIRTINRPTLKNAIESALKEFSKVIVVADAVNLNLNKLPRNVEYLRTGQKFDSYGNAGINMGAYACDTEYFCLLDDDDEFIPGAGKVMESKVKEKPSVDIWIPGIHFVKENFYMCVEPGMRPGNVAVPTYRTMLLYNVPFSAKLLAGNQDYVDYAHVNSLVSEGYTIDWYGEPLYRIRPNLPGTNGRGQ